MWVIRSDLASSSDARGASTSAVPVSVPQTVRREIGNLCAVTMRRVAARLDAVAGELGGEDVEGPVGVDDDIEAAVGVGARGTAHEAENSRACADEVASAWSSRGRARADSVLTTT